MRSRCEAFEDAIFNHVRFGTPLPKDALTHIEGCAKCKQALDEATQVTGIMLEADFVPPAPDCRSAVMSRISQPRRVFWPAWVYVPAGVALASVAIGGILTFGLMHQPGTPQTAKCAKPAIVIPAAPEHVDVAKAPGKLRNNSTRTITRKPAGRVHAGKEPVQIAMAVAEPAVKVPSVPEPAMRRDDPAPIGDVVAPKADSEMSPDYKDTAARPGPAPLRSSLAMSFSTTATPADTAGSAAFENDEADGFTKETRRNLTVAIKPVATLALKARFDNVTTQTERPVAIAAANWNPPSPPSDNDYSYSYTDLDPSTGRLMNCSVERTGDVVNIYVEGKPWSDAPSQRGSIDNESITNV